MYISFLFIIFNLILLTIFAYEDIKNRAIKDGMFYASLIFLLVLIIYSTLYLKFNIIFMLFFSILGSVLFIYSIKTGNIGEGDVPILLSTFLILIVFTNIIFFIYFLLIFVSSLITLPFFIYKKIFNKFKRIIPIFLFIVILSLIFLNYFEFSLIFLFILSSYAFFNIYGKIDKLYEESVKYMKPSDIVIGDFIINSLLKDSQKKIALNPNRITFVDKDLLKKLNKNEKYPIYYNSLPMIVPIFISFVLIIIMMII